MDEFKILTDGFFKELAGLVIFQATTPWVKGEDIEAQAIIGALVGKGGVPFSFDSGTFLGANGELGINFPLPSTFPE